MRQFRLGLPFCQLPLSGELGRIDPDRLSEALSSLTSDSDMTAAISRATANEEAVRTRLDLATKAFSGNSGPAD
jgi:hypothetical protein